jgi:hypothetical protein
MPAVASGFDDSGDDDEVSDCPECGAEVYLIADCCPKCGYWFEAGDRNSMKGRRRIKSEMRIVKIGGAILGAVVVLALLIIGAMSFLGGG